MPESCAAAECKQSSDQSHVSFFKFPLDPERCKLWVENCRRPDLQTQTPEYLHTNLHLCSRHFDPSALLKEGEAKVVLKDGAVPTIFNVPVRRVNAQYSRKRTRPRPVANAPVEAKKAKDDPQAAPTKEPVVEPPPETPGAPDHPPEPEEEDPATTRAKEVLKIHFKETLAYTGFNVGNSAAVSAAKSLVGGATGQPDIGRACADRIDPKEVLKLGKAVMCVEIRNCLRMARFFSIILQDKTSVEGKDQIPFFIRTVSVDGFPQRHFLGFLPCELDADSLFLALISEIRNTWRLRMEHCRGFSYLTKGHLCHKLKEVACRMLRDFPQVVLAPSEPYAFNMWLVRSLPAMPVQDVVDTVEEAAALLKESPALRRRLQARIAATYAHVKGGADRVQESCRDDWQYGTDAFQTMLDILEPLLGGIGEMCTSALSEADAGVVERLLRLREKLRRFDFIVTLVILKNTLCCVSILNLSLRGIISISSTLQYTISNSLKLLGKQLQEIAICHRKWFSDAVGRAKKLGVPVAVPADAAEPSPEDHYRETLTRMILQYLLDEVRRVLGVEMVRILRWLSLVPSYMADHNFSIRKDKVADANLNNLARPDSFYDELGCWEVKWRHASKRRILPTGVFATLKIPDIGFYPNIQSLLRVLGSIPCINADVGVYGGYDLVLDRYASYLNEVPAEKRQCGSAFVYVNQDVHINADEMVAAYVADHPDVLQLLLQDDVMEVQPSVMENDTNDTSKEDPEEPREMTLAMEPELPRASDRASSDKEALRSALRAALTAAVDDQADEVEYVTRSEMNEVLRVCEGVVRDGVVSEMGSSFFSLFVDRVARFGERELLPLFVKFVDSFDVMRAELMGFVEADLDTESLCTRLYDIVTTDWHLDLRYCRGQAYLGSGEVAYRLKAFAGRVQEQYPLAICTHCSCYSFNAWWSCAAPVPAVIRALDVLERVLAFFGSAPDLEKRLDQVLAVGLHESFEKVNELQGNFCTSWLAKHDTYDVFAQILEPLCDCLGGAWSPSLGNQAKRLLQAVSDFDFIVAVVALKNVSSFTRELSAALQKDYLSAAAQLSQIGGIVATLNRLKTNIKVFHQNWFDEACAVAQSLGVPVKVPDNVPVPRDSLLKPAAYYRDAVSIPLVEHLISSVKEHFSDEHKEALNFLSLVPCSVTTGYTFESLRSKTSLYVADLPDPENFFTELSCWKVKWKTKAVSPGVPDSIFQTLRLPLMQYFSNINTLLKIMAVLPSTALDYCGQLRHHQAFQDYLRATPAARRTACVAVLKVGADFDRDLDRMVTQCLKVTPKTLEGICLDKEAKTLKNPEGKTEDNHKDDDEEMEVQQEQPRNRPDFNELKAADNFRNESVEQKEAQTEALTAPEVAPESAQADENGLSDRPSENLKSFQTVFKVSSGLARRNRVLRELPKEDQEAILQELGACRWDQRNTNHILPDVEILESIARSIREAVVSEVQESPFFSIIGDKAVAVDDRKYVPVFVRYVDECLPRVELLGFLPLDPELDVELQAGVLSGILTDDWGLQMSCCRGQSFMCPGAGGQGLRKMSRDFSERFPLAPNTPSESCGLAYWLAVGLCNEPIAKVLGVVEDLLLFFDQSPRLHAELALTREGLLNPPREALAEVPETCLSRWKKTEDFFDILVDMLEGVLSCLDAVSGNADGSWSSSMSIHALMLSTAVREADFVISLVILKNACAPLRSCSTVLRCGNPADIVCELERIPLVISALSKTLENVSEVHRAWFEEAAGLAARVAGTLSYPESVNAFESPETGYRETVSIPVLTGLIQEMNFNFSECHLKALRLLSLLPACDPLPVLPDAPDKLYAAYRADLPDPDAAEAEINAWAAAWRDKYQDVQPPASISETLDHPEAGTHPNVAALLRLVAVLPSVSMECDLMKTTLGTLRSLVREDVRCQGSKTSSVMLLMHRQVLQSLAELVKVCMDRDPDSHGFLSQVKHLLSELDVNADVSETPSVENAEELNGTRETPETPRPGAEDSDPTVTPEHGVPEPKVSSTILESTDQPDESDQVVILELVAALPDATSEPGTAVAEAGLTIEPILDVATSDPAPQVVQMEPVVLSLVEPEKIPDEPTQTEDAAAENVVEPHGADEDANMDVTPTEPVTKPVAEMPTQDIKVQDLTQEVAKEPAEAPPEVPKLTEAIEGAIEHEAEVQGAAREPVAEIIAAPPDGPEVQSSLAEVDTIENKVEVQSPNTEPVEEMEAQGVTKELDEKVLDVPEVSSTTTEEITLENSAEVQGVSTESVVEVREFGEAPPEFLEAPRSESVKDTVDHKAEILVDHAEPVVQVEAQGITKKPAEAPPDVPEVPSSATIEVQDDTTVEMELASAPPEHPKMPGSAAIEETVEHMAEVQGVAMETVEMEAPELKEASLELSKDITLDHEAEMEAQSVSMEVEELPPEVPEVDSTATEEITMENCEEPVAENESQCVTMEAPSDMPTVPTAVSGSVDDSSMEFTSGREVHTASEKSTKLAEVTPPSDVPHQGGTTENVIPPLSSILESSSPEAGSVQSANMEPVVEPPTKSITGQDLVQKEDLQGVSQSVNDNDTMIPTTQSLDPEPISKLQDSTTQLKTLAQDEPEVTKTAPLTTKAGTIQDMELAPASTEDSQMENAIDAKDVKTGDIITQPITVEEVSTEVSSLETIDVAPGEAPHANTDVTPAACQSASQDVSSETTGARDVITVPVVAFQDVNQESMGVTRAEAETALEKVSSTQDVLVEFMELAPEDEPKTEPKNVSPNSQAVTQESMEQAQAEIPSVTKEAAPQKSSTPEVHNDLVMTKENPVTEHVPLTPEGSTESAPPKDHCDTSDPTSVVQNKPQDVSDEPQECKALIKPSQASSETSQPETRSVSPELLPASQAVTTETRIESTCVDHTASSEVSTTPAVSKDVTESMPRISSVKSPTNSMMEHKSVTQVHTEVAQAVAIGPPSTTQAVPMETSSDMTTTPVQPVQDVLMEPVKQTQGTSEPKQVPQDVSMKQVKEALGASEELGQDVSMEQVKEALGTVGELKEVGQDVSMEQVKEALGTVGELKEVGQDVLMEQVKETLNASGEVGRDVSMEQVKDTPDASGKLKEVGQGVSVETETCIQDEPMDTSNSQDGSSEPVASSVPSVPEVNSQKVTTEAPCQDPPLDGSAQAVNGVAGHATRNDSDGQESVQDVMDRSGRAGQDGTESLKSAAQASQDAQSGVAPNKGVLSFYAYPSQEVFLSELEKSKYFSITYEPHVEIEGHVYIPVGVCYLERNEKLCEDVLAYVPLEDNLGAFVDATIAALSEKWGLNLANCRGQSLLTVGATVTQVKAAAALFSQRFPLAICTFNNSVSLNTWLARSCVEISDSYLWVESLLQWMTDDPEKLARLQRIVMLLYRDDEQKQSELKLRLGRNQWDRSHDTIDFTVDVLQAVILCLAEMKDGDEAQADAAQAVNFLCILQNFELILILVVMKNILGLTKDLSRSLQGEPLDMFRALNTLPGLVSSLKGVTSNLDAHLQSWYQEAVVLSEKLNIGVDPSSRDSLILHYRDVVSKGAIEHSASEMTQLFSDRARSVLCCTRVVPRVFSETDGGCTDPDVFKFYRGDLPNWGSLRTELQAWTEKWRDAAGARQALPTRLLDTFKTLDAQSYPNLETLVRLLMVLPCCKREDSIRPGKTSLIEFNQQKSLLELYPL